jgi:hypothetical protein
LAQHIVAFVLVSLGIVAQYFISLRYGISLAWFAAGALSIPLIWVLYLLKEKGRFSPHAYLAVLVAVVYGMWYVNGLTFGFSLAWLTVAVLGWPLLISVFYLGKERARLVFGTPRGALLMSLSVSGGMLVSLYPACGLFGLVVFLMPLFVWSHARRKALE